MRKLRIGVVVTSGLLALCLTPAAWASRGGNPNAAGVWTVTSLGPVKTALGDAIIARRHPRAYEPRRHLKLIHGARYRGAGRRGLRPILRTNPSFAG